MSKPESSSSVHPSTSIDGPVTQRAFLLANTTAKASEILGVSRFVERVLSLHIPHGCLPCSWLLEYGTLNI